MSSFSILNVFAQMGLAPPPLPTAPPTWNGPVFNYSTQSLNSTEQSKEMLRRKLAQDPDHRYTYSQHYHSMTVVPVNTTTAAKLREEESKRKWLTSEGFKYPSVPSSLSSNAHPKHPHQSRVDDLAEVGMYACTLVTLPQGYLEGISVDSVL